MQRTAICLVAVLTLLAGCSGGVGGGSDATETSTPVETLQTTPVTTATPAPTPTPTPTPTAKENTSDGTDTLPTVKTRLDTVSVNSSAVLYGETIRINATVTNLEDTTGKTNLTANVGNRTLPSERVTLKPDATRTVTLYAINTSFLDPGLQFATVSTATDSEIFQVDIQPKNELKSFIREVRSQTYTMENSTILGPDHVRFTFDTEESQRAIYKGGGSNLMPVPQAAAFEMATSDYAPSKVSVRVPSQYENEPIAYRTTFNKSLATKLYNGTVDAREFRGSLHQHATGDRKQIHAPHWQKLGSPEPERYTFFTGDRARQQYATELAERLNNTGREYLTVVDHGLYNGTQTLPDTARRLGPNESIYVTIQMDEFFTSAPWRNYSSTRHGVGVDETLWKLGNTTEYRTYGERPAFVQLRYVWPDGVRHTYINIPTYMALEGVKRGSMKGFYFQLVWDQEFEKRYNDDRYD